MRDDIEFYFIIIIFFRVPLRPRYLSAFIELGLKDGSQLIVADATTPNSIEFHLKLHAPMDT